MDGIDLFLSIIYAITLYYSVFWLVVYLTTTPEDKTKRIKKWPIVTVIIPAYNEEKVISKTLLSAINLDYPREKLQIIVVDDGSSDNTSKKVKEIIKKHEDTNITLIRQKNSGKWVALNNALKLAKGEFFACLDADSYIESNALKKILPHFYSKKVGAVLPLMKVENPENMLQKLQWYEYLVNMFYKRLISYLNCVHVTPGPFSVYRTSIIKKLGGFKEAFLTEDLEMALRLQKNNYLIIQLSDPVVHTVAPHSLPGLYNQRKRWNKGSVLNTLRYKEMLFNKEYGDFGLMQLPVVLFSGGLSVALMLAFIYFSILKPMYNILKKLILVNFDIKTLLSDMHFEFNPLNLDFYRLLIGVVVLALSLLIFYLAHKFANEDFAREGKLSMILYLFFYYLILGFVWISIYWDFLLGKFNQKTWVKAR